MLIKVRLQELIASEKKKYEVELDGIKGEKSSLEKQQKKLLEAHYHDTIPVDLLKTEQKKLEKERASIEHEIQMHILTFDQVSKNLQTVDIVEDCEIAYRTALPSVKKHMNRAIFEKILIGRSDDKDISAEPNFMKTYDTFIEPI